MNDDQIINKEFHILQRQKLLKDNEKFVYNKLSKNIIYSLENINLSVKDCLEIGVSSKKIYQYIQLRFPKINYTVMDISKKILEKNINNRKLILLDHDQWDLKLKKFDLIISNFYLHITNNFDLLLKNINNSLNSNGFFIASIPSNNCFNEIKKCMIQADIKIYGGAYRRFIESFSIEKITEILKKNNYKIPVIEVENLEFRYKNFSSLLKDIRYLANSNIYYDRKKTFEKKTYFKTVEEIFWKQHSKNNLLLLHLEIFYITGWKDDSSKQKTLKPS